MGSGACRRWRPAGFRPRAGSSSRPASSSNELSTPIRPRALAKSPPRFQSDRLEPGAGGMPARGGPGLAGGEDVVAHGALRKEVQPRAEQLAQGLAPREAAPRRRRYHHVADRSAGPTPLFARIQAQHGVVAGGVLEDGPDLRPDLLPLHVGCVGRDTEREDADEGGDEGIVPARPGFACHQGILSRRARAICAQVRSAQLVAGGRSLRRGAGRLSLLHDSVATMRTGALEWFSPQLDCPRRHEERLAALQRLLRLALDEERERALVTKPKARPDACACPRRRRGPSPPG